MKILFTGNGTSGSWKIRGEQLGSACGGIIKPKATRQDLKQADVVVVVKRVSDQLLEDIRASGKPWIFDIVDFYPQPECTNWSKSQSIDWVKTRLKLLHPNAIIWPNKCMMHDCANGAPGLVLPHHYRPGMTINPIRENVKLIGYEGARNYVGNWLGPILEQCIKRGWQFRINTFEMAEMDIVLAIRDDHVNGYAQRHWKSNVKLANAHGSGTPFIGPLEQGYLENSTGLEMWADDVRDLPRVFDRLESSSLRKNIRDTFLNKSISVEKCATQLKEFIDAM